MDYDRGNWFESMFKNGVEEGALPEKYIWNHAAACSSCTCSRKNVDRIWNCRIDGTCIWKSADYHGIGICALARGDVGSFENAVFFFLFPIFVAIPFGWSLAGEIRSGYTAQMIARTGRKNYFPAKLIAVFLSGAVVVMIPLIVSFLIVSMYLPSLTPELCYPYGGLLQRSMWTSLYYAHPLVYTILYILLDGVYGGLFASLCVAVAFRVKYRTMVVLVPFCLYTVLEYLDSNFVVAMRLGYDTSPAKFLRPMAIANEHSGLIICAEAVLLLALAVLPTLRKGRKYEAI